MTKSGGKVVFCRYFLLLSVFGHEISYSISQLRRKSSCFSGSKGPSHLILKFEFKKTILIQE